MQVPKSCCEALLLERSSACQVMSLFKLGKRRRDAKTCDGSRAEVLRVLQSQRYV